MTKIKSLSVTIWILMALIYPSSSIWAKQIPIGLDWRKGVFIQEYWVEGKPQYCVANLQDQDINLKISSYQTSTAPADPQQMWPISAKGIKCLDAQPFLGEHFVGFQLDQGAWLGLLKTLALPVRDKISQETVSSPQGLNGSCRSLGMELEQTRLWFKSGQEITFNLKVPINKGNITLKRDERAKYLPGIWSKDISSANLPIEIKDDQITINTNHPGSEPSQQSLQWRFVAPVVTTPSMFQISTKIQVSDKKFGCFIRGILIKP